MDVNCLFSMDDVKDLDSFFKEVDDKQEVIIIKNNRPVYRITRIGTNADKRNGGAGTVNLWKAMSDYLETCENKTAHASEITANINQTHAYITRNGDPVKTVQVRSRAQAKPEFFSCSKGNMISLVKPYEE